MTDAPDHESTDSNCKRLADLDADAVLRDVLSLFGKKHTLAITYEFAFSEDPLRFRDIEDRLEISSTTLSNRLAALTDAGYVERHSYDEVPPRVEYEATEKTLALAAVFEGLYDWVETYERDDGRGEDVAETA